MPTVIETVNDIEDRVVETLESAQEPVIDAVRRLADYVAGVLPEDRPSLPYIDQLPTPTELVESQFAFAQRLLDLQHQFAKAVLDAASPMMSAKPVTKAKSTAKKAA
jgi:hypothetical protein